MNSRPLRDRANIVWDLQELSTRESNVHVGPPLTASSKEIFTNYCKGSRRQGVRKKRTATQTQSRSITEPSNVGDETARDITVYSPSQSSISLEPSLFTSSTPQSSFIAKGSVLAYDAPAEPSPLGAINSPAFGVSDPVIRAIQADILPRAPLLQALKDAYIENVLPFHPVLDPSDFSTDSPVMLQQAICLVGSLMRHDQSNLTFAHSQYDKVKALVHFKRHHDPVVLLKTCCLLACWSPASTDLITLDGPWQWAGIAIRLAIQMGLHKQATYKHHANASCLRRIFWHLIMTDKMMVACWGRPPALSMDDSDLLPLSLADFSRHAVGAALALEGHKVIHVIGKIGQLNARKREIPSEEMGSIITLLCDWQRDLPHEARLFDSGGERLPFSRVASEIHIYYFAAIIMIQMLNQRQHTQWQPSTSSLVASSCMAALYDEINSREQAAYLLHHHGFLIMAAALPLIFHSPQAENRNSISDQLDVICSVLLRMKAKYGGASFVLSKIHRLRQWSTASERPASQSGPSNATVYKLESCLNQLFPFPSKFCSQMESVDPTALDGNDRRDDLALESDFTMFDMLGMDMTSFDMLESSNFLGY
ncbi:hypothetical protein PT974_09882 [Cladobotryum mycophilum]|uniref:Xylanolytic transcriptional activator regulatory domain-containing protein n=1 Tax=Cladobotryum mycophilum TaxID=491253 RepID=A0ABR0SHE8_9HYPO